MTPPAHIDGRARAPRTPGPRRDEQGGLGRRAGYAVVLLTLLTLLAVVGAYLGLVPQPSSPPAKQQPTVVGPPASGPGLDLTAPPQPDRVLGSPQIPPAAQSAKSAVRARLAAALDDASLGKQIGLAVASLESGQPVWQLGNETVVTPASTLKLLTTTAALAAMGPDHRFPTSVERRGDSKSIVLVGGGDPLLTDELPPRSGDAPYPPPASLEELAIETASQLEGGAVRRVRLTYDVSLFSGPAANPAWEKSYVPESIVSPISPLWVDEGREVAGLALRVEDPALVAAERFAALLRQRGVVVTGSIREGVAPAKARTVAEVDSPRLDEIVQHVIETSDNEGAEVLLRQTALAEGRRGSSKAGVEAVESVLSGLDVDLSQAELYDGSGLARSNLVPTGAIVKVLQIASSPQQPDLRTVVSMLPVAGFTGSLESRFADSAPAGLGLVRAKTGTLTGVHGLAGLVTTVDGDVLVFAAVADRVPVVKTLDAIAQLEQITALLATCGC